MSEVAKILLTGAIGLLTQWLVVTVKASVKPFSSRFRASLMDIGNAAQYVRTGGSGPAVLLLHGFGDTGDMWQPLAEVLIAEHTVVVPDLRGMGLSSHPEAGYEKTSQARDLAAILDRLAIDRVTLVTHDIGNMVGYAFAAQFPRRVTKWIVMDAPIPGLGTWEKQLVNPLVWHFNFRGPDESRFTGMRTGRLPRRQDGLCQGIWSCEPRTKCADNTTERVRHRFHVQTVHGGEHSASGKAGQTLHQRRR